MVLKITGYAPDGTPQFADDGTGAPGAQTGDKATPGLSVTTAENNTYKVYMGRKTHLLEPGRGGGSSEQEDDVADMDTAAGSIYGWSRPQLKDWENKLIEAGFIDPKQGYDFSDLVSKWQTAVDQAGKFFTLGGKKVSPWDVIDLNSEVAGTKKAKEASTHVTTSTSVDEIDDASAHSLLNSAFQQATGRAANPNELEDFASRLSAAVRANPHVTKTTTKTDSTGAETSSNSVTSGGFSSAAAQEMADGKAKMQPDYGAYQAATTYFGALQSAIQSPV